MFRDSRIAHRERELAELRAERDRLREENEDLKEDLEEEQTKTERSSWFKNWLEHRRVMKAKKAERKMFRRRSFGSGFRIAWTAHTVIIGLVFAAIVGVIGLSIYHYTTDPVEGTVYARDYHPPQTTCTTTNNTTTCSTTPESWTVSIGGDDGRTGTWHVSESEYNRLSRGDWFCYTDMFHPASDCHGPPR